VTTEEGQPITLAFVNDALKDEMNHLKYVLGEEAFRKRKFPEAAKLWEELLAAKELPTFLTHRAYQEVTKPTLLPLPSKL